MADVGDGAAVFVMFVVGALVVPLAFILQVRLSALGVRRDWPCRRCVTVGCRWCCCRAFKACCSRCNASHKARAKAV